MEAAAAAAAAEAAGVAATTTLLLAPLAHGAAAPKAPKAPEWNDVGERRFEGGAGMAKLVATMAMLWTLPEANILVSRESEG